MNSSSASPASKGARWAELMILAQNADAGAYRLLLQELVPYLGAFLRKKFGSVSYLDDLVQEIMIGIHKARHTYQPDRPFLPWLHAIIRYKSIDLMRTRLRRESREVLNGEAIDQESETFWAAETNTDLGDRVLLAVAALPLKQRTTVEMLKVEGLSVKEVANRTGWSESAIKVTAHRAYEALRRRFRGESDES